MSRESLKRISIEDSYHLSLGDDSIDFRVCFKNNEGYHYGFKIGQIESKNEFCVIDMSDFTIHDLSQFDEIYLIGQETLIVEL